jgi:hypothetical protein
MGRGNIIVGYIYKLFYYLYLVIREEIALFSKSIYYYKDTIIFYSYY